MSTDDEGCPMAVEVFLGNNADPTAFIAAVEKVCAKFKLAEVVMVDDRGHDHVGASKRSKDLGGLGWITSPRAPAIAALVDSAGVTVVVVRQIQLS